MMKLEQLVHHYTSHVRKVDKDIAPVMNTIKPLLTIKKYKEPTKTTIPMDVDSLLTNIHNARKEENDLFDYLKRNM